MATHPQTVWDATELNRLRSVRTTTHAALATNLMNHCNAAWSDDEDLGQAADILNGAVGYDVLYDLLTSGQRTACLNKIAASAQDLANAADSGIWWTTDLVQNHNWINYAAIGVAGQALEG